jgi:hypothetical protein
MRRSLGRSGIWATSLLVLATSWFPRAGNGQFVSPSPTPIVLSQFTEPARAAPPATIRPDRTKNGPTIGLNSRTPIPAATPVKSPVPPLVNRDPYLSDLDQILGSAEKPLPINVCFPGQAELSDVQIAQGASITQALALHAGYRPLLPSYGSELVPDEFNVIIGTVDQVHHYLSEQEAKKITKGYVAIQRLPAGAKQGFVLLVTGRAPEDVDSTILSLGFVQVQFPDAASTTIREVILPSTPTFIRQAPLEADKSLPFAELQKGGVPIKPLPTGGVSLDLFFPGYFRTDSDAAVTINLHYLLQGRTFQSSSSMVVRINGREISTNQSAARPSAGGGTERSLAFPVKMFQYGRNLLEITTSSPASSSGSNDSLRVFGDSELGMPKIDTGPNLPDLRLASRTFYPFVGQPDGSDLAVLLTERSEEIITATWTLLARLAQSANTLLYAAQLTFDQYDLRRHVVVVGTYDHLPPAFRSIVALRAFDEAHVNVPLAELDSLSSGTNLKQLLEQLLDQRRRHEEELNQKLKLANLPQVSIADRDFGVLAMAPPPSATRGWSLVVTGFTSLDVLRRVQSLVQDPFWMQVRGDIDRWKELPDSFQARVPGEARANAAASLVEMPLGERIDFRIWVGIVAATLILFVIMTVRLMGKFDEAFVMRQGKSR